MKRFLLSKAAENDLRKIWRESKDTWGERQAESFLRALDLCFQQLSDYPAMGHRCDELRPGYRCFPKGEHHIYYSEKADGVFVTRIRAQRMLPRKAMFDEGSAAS